jgi:hypothetical protein
MDLQTNFPHLNWKNQYNKLKEFERKKFSKNINKCGNENIEYININDVISKF